MSASHVSRAIVQSKEMGKRFVAREGPRSWPRRLEITQKDPRPTGKAHPVFDPLNDAATNTRARWRGKTLSIREAGESPLVFPLLSASWTAKWCRSCVVLFSVRFVCKASRLRALHSEGLTLSGVARRVVVRKPIIIGL